MWNRNWPTQDFVGEIAVSPREVLYDFDMPLIFTTTIGLEYLLFFFIDESEGNPVYLAVRVSEELVEFLKGGKISVYGALLDGPHKIIELGDDFEILNCWQCKFEDVPIQYLPERSVALMPGQDPAPNSIQQVKSYFSLGFEGARMSSSGMKLGDLRNLVDQAYNISRKLLSPLDFKNAKSATFDYLVAEPQFGSLVISFKKPIINEINASKYVEDGYNYDGSFLNEREYFLDTISEVFSTSEEHLQEVVMRNYDFLETIQSIIPSSKNNLDTVEFSASHGHDTRFVSISRELGEKVYDAYDEIEFELETISGRIQIFNQRTNNFVIKNFGSERLTTCHLRGANFARLYHAGIIGSDKEVRVTGRLFERSRRDLLEVQDVEAIDRN